MVCHAARFQLALGVLLSILCVRCGSGGPLRRPADLTPEKKLVWDCAQVIDEIHPGAGQDALEDCARVLAAGAEVIESGAVLWTDPKGQGPDEKWMAQVADGIGKAYRSHGQPARAAPASYRLRVDLEDEPGLLAQGLGSALKAKAVAWRGASGWRVVPVMPLTARLTLGPPGSLPVGPDPADRLSSAVLAGQADELFERGDRAGAFLLARDALTLAPVDLSPCTYRAALSYLAWKTALDGGEEPGEVVAWLEKECFGAKVGSADELEAKVFFRLLYDLEPRRGSGWKADEPPSEWISRQVRAQALAEMQERQDDLHGARRKLIGAFLDELQVAFVKPADVCDEDTPAARQEVLDEAGKTLYRLGRRDLTSHVPGLGLLDLAKLADLTLFAQLEREAKNPRDRWRLSSSLQSLLFQIWMAGGMRFDPAQTQPLCDDLFAELKRLWEQDRWPDAVDRNLSRLAGASTALVACQDRSAVQALYQQTLDRAGEQERGKVGILIGVLGMVPDLFMALISGQQARLMTGLTDLHSAVEKQLAGLGDSEEDRALAGALQSFLCIRPLLSGRTAVALAELELSERNLGAVPLASGGDAPLMIRVAPGLHLVSGYLLAGAYSLFGRGADVPALLGRLRKRLETAVPHSLAALDAAGHSTEATRLALAGQALLEALLTDPEGVDRERLRTAAMAVEGAKVELPEQGGWWNLGLALARLALGDSLAVIFAEELGLEARDRMLSQGRDDLQSLVERIPVWFELSGPSWDFLRLFPVGHRIMEAFVSLPTDREDRFAAAVVQAGPHLEQVLAGLEGRRRPEFRMAHLVENGSLPDLVMELAWGVREIGVRELTREGSEGMGALSSRVERIDAVLKAAGRVELKLLLDLGWGAVLKGSGDFANAGRWFDRAVETVAGTEAARLEHPLRALKAGTLASTDLSTARRELRLAMAPGDRARGCGKTHPSHALYLPMAWLSEVAGEHELAMAQLDQYLRLVNKGFAGEGEVELKYSFQKGSAIFTATLNAAVSNLVVTTSAEQAFQVGAGGSSGASDQETLSVEDEPLAHRRNDRVLLAQLQAAMYSMLRGDDRAGGKYLRGARDTLRLITNGHQATLGVYDTGGLEDSRKWMYTPLLFWTGALAKVRGHWAVGDFLEEAGLFRAASYEHPLEDLGLNPGDPAAYLGQLPTAEALQPLLTTWFQESPRRKGLTDPLRDRLQAMGKKDDGLVPGFSGPLQAGLRLYREGKSKEGLAILTECGTACEHPAVRCLALILTARLDGGLPEQAALDRTLANAVQAGFSDEALELLREVGPKVVGERGLKQGFALADRVLAGFPAGENSYSRGQALLVKAQLAHAGGDRAGFVDLMVECLALGRGSANLNQQLNLEWEVIGQAVRLGRIEFSRNRIRDRLPFFEAVLGADDPLLIRLRSLELASMAQLGLGLDPRTVAGLLEAAKAAHNPDPLSVEFLTRLGERIQQGGDPKELGEAYLGKAISL